MPEAARRSSPGVRNEAPRDAGSRSSICTDVLDQPAPSPRMTMKFGFGGAASMTWIDSSRPSRTARVE